MKRAWPLLLLGLLVIAAYLPALRAGFVWDDDAWVWSNPHVRGETSILRVWHTAEVPGQNYPLTYTFFWAQRLFWGLNPVGFHLANVLLHALNAALLFVILRRLGLKNAWWAAAIFGLHPINVESVAWVTEAKNVLSAFFIFLSLLFFLAYEARKKRKDYSFSLILYLLALCSKTFVLTYPAVLLILTWYRHRRASRKYLLDLAPFFLLSLLAGAFTRFYEVSHVGVGGEAWAMPFAGRIAVAGRAFWFYLAKILLPARLTFIYPRWEIAPGEAGPWIAPSLAAALLAMLWAGRRRWGKGPFAAAAVYAVLLAPALGFVSFFAQIYSFVSDHYAYLAMIAPAAAGVGLFAGKFARRFLMRAAGAAILTCLFVLTFFRATAYRDLETLLRDTVGKNPECWMAFTNLGNELFSRGRVEEAAHYLEEAVRLRPESARIHANLGNALLRIGMVEEAIQRQREALRLDPAYAPARNNLGVIFFEQGKIGEAVGEYREAIRIDPNLAEAHSNLGEALNRLGRTDEAEESLRLALRIMPSSPEARNNLGIALSRQGKLEEAVDQYREALRIMPDYAEAHYNLGIDLDSLGRLEEAAASYRRAIELNPRYAEAHANLGVTLWKLGRTEEAVEHYREAIRLRPDSPEAHHNLGTALLRLGREEEARTHLAEAARLGSPSPPR